MKTSIIIPVHNRWNLTSRCINSIRRCTPEPFELIIVDNGSTDETAESLKQRSEVRYIRNETNLGFPKACNQGIEAASGEYVLFLNNDTVVTPGWLRRLQSVFDNHEDAGLAGPVSNYCSGYFQQIPVPYRDPETELDAFAEEHARVNQGLVREVYRLAGFCLLTKRTVLEKAGGFDERFGIGTYEDDDLCLRVTKEGFRLFVALDAFVHHEGHATFTATPDLNMHSIMNENRQIASRKWGFDLPEHLFSRKLDLTVSLCMIVKNEEAVLGRCLDSVRDLVDEIVIVDTGSTDRTKEIAAKYTDRIFDFPWVNDFSAARNFSFDQARMDYILWLDADDVLEGDNREKFRKLREELMPWVDAVTMAYHLSFDERGEPTHSLRRNRLVKRLPRFRWTGAVHEVLEVGGHIIDSDVAISHRPVKRSSRNPRRNLDIYENLVAEGRELTPRDLFYYANECLDHGLHERAIELYEQFLNDGRGWVEDEIAACGKMADCHLALGNHRQSMEAVLRSFRYDVPRAENCCRLGFLFMREGKYEQAAYWYERALEAKPPRLALVNHACYNYLPHLQLCVCYDRLGQIEKAYHHNEMAARYRPDSPSVLHNRKYFEARLNKTK
ncbi:glycosyltransferase [Staphylospora marina]|uniref:glycosyltransferase n=1 Tax=Staphylospora marina TaxID=2490858 RepID=UPI0013DE2029|nr:glycosyltransferase [Staphylospora marina]